MEENAKNKMSPRLTRQHICPNIFEKMRVKFPTQIFSRTVAAAIKTIWKTTKCKNSCAQFPLSTAQFVEKNRQNFRLS